eukprot:m.243615 g.243615  ORF g.243615 m.243615 type:complete len:78 (+) comp19455_c0_seq1:2145-2378(+)
MTTGYWSAQPGQSSLGVILEKMHCMDAFRGCCCVVCDVESIDSLAAWPTICCSLLSCVSLADYRGRVVGGSHCVVDG